MSHHVHVRLNYCLQGMENEITRKRHVTLTMIRTL
jgi:hypothetical protein